MIHELKCWPEYMELIATGRKTFEVRDCSDRTFREHDVVILQGWDPGTETYLDRDRIAAIIGYVLPRGAWGLPLNMVVFSLLKVTAIPAAKVEPR